MRLRHLTIASAGVLALSLDAAQRKRDEAAAGEAKPTLVTSTGCPPSPGNTPEQNLHDKLKDSQG